jgi:hypothetical protein
LHNPDAKELEGFANAHIVRNKELINLASASPKNPEDGKGLMWKQAYTKALYVEFIVSLRLSRVVFEKRTAVRP